MTSEALRSIRDTLRARGFHRDRARTDVYRFLGPLHAAGRTINVALTIRDGDFLKPPTVQILDPDDQLDGLRAHVEHDGNLCYLRPEAVVLDRFDPGGTISLCLNQAEKALTDILSRNPRPDIEAEFLQYWRGATVFSDVGSHSSEARLHSHSRSDGSELTILSQRGKTPSFFQRLGFPFKNKGDALVIHSVNPLQPGTGAFPPENLADGLGWLEAQSPIFREQAERHLKKHLEKVAIIFVSAPNAVCGFEASPSPRTLRRLEKGGFRKEALWQQVLAEAGSNKIQRYGGLKMDADFVVARNLQGGADLRGRRIVLAGCGTIGSHLARFLAQSGAGFGGGQLHLFDPEDLRPANLGRHLLGIEHIGHAKAEGLKDELIRFHMETKVRATPRSVLDSMGVLEKADLVIDATGDEAVSNALNVRAVTAWRGDQSFPPVLYVRLFGSGAAAQALFSPGLDTACFRCLYSAAARDWRHSPMKQGGPAELVPATCGDGAYIAYPVSAPVTAAALALDMALAWAGGDVRPYFRTRRLDFNTTKEVKDRTEKPFPGCHVCGEGQP